MSACVCMQENCLHCSTIVHINLTHARSLSLTLSLTIPPSPSRAISLTILPPLSLSHNISHTQSFSACCNCAIVFSLIISLSRNPSLSQSRSVTRDHERYLSFSLSKSQYLETSLSHTFTEMTDNISRYAYLNWLISNTWCV